MTPFDPISAAIGGALIGLAVTLLMLLNGRLAGISGVMGDLLEPGTLFKGWRVAFLAGLIAVPLVVGAAIFGVGWGLSGLCPGPAIENLASLSPKVFVFVAAMTIGMIAHDAWRLGATYWRPHRPEPVG